MRRQVTKIRKFMNFNNGLFFILILGDKNFIDLLKKAQNYSLEDQRGRIDSKHLEIPEFLLSSSLIKSQSMCQNMSNYANNINQMKSSNNFSNLNNTLNQNYSYTNLNKSTLSLPIATSNLHAYSPKSSNRIIVNENSARSNDKHMYNTTQSNNNFKMPSSKGMYSTRSRSPIVILYDNDDYDNLNIDYNKNSSNNEYDPNKTNNSTNSNYLYEQPPNNFYNIHNDSNDLNFKNYDYFNTNILKSPNNYESISETNTPIKYINGKSIEDIQLKTPINLVSDPKTNPIRSISSTSLQRLSNKKNTKISYV